MNAEPDETRLLASRAAALVLNGEDLAERIRSENPIYTASVVGLQYENRAARLPAVRVGDRVFPLRDYENPFDVNAIQIMHEAGELGYAPRHVARLVAPQMDAGSSFAAIISSVTRDPEPQVEITIAPE